jgi:hypothetical protein
MAVIIAGRFNLKTNFTIKGGGSMPGGPIDPPIEPTEPTDPNSSAILLEDGSGYVAMEPADSGRFAFES